MKKNNWKWGDEHDAVAAAPNSHLILLENENARVLEIILKPKQKEPMHTHKWKSVMIVDSSADIRYCLESRESEIYKAVEATYEKPYIEWLEPEGLHSVENLDQEKTYHAIRIEIKK